MKRTWCTWMSVSSLKMDSSHKPKDKKTQCFKGCTRAVCSRWIQLRSSQKGDILFNIRFIQKYFYNFRKAHLMSHEECKCILFVFWVPSNFQLVIVKPEISTLLPSLRARLEFRCEEHFEIWVDQILGSWNSLFNFSSFFLHRQKCDGSQADTDRQQLCKGECLQSGGCKTSFSRHKQGKCDKTAIKEYSESSECHTRVIVFLSLNLQTNPLLTTDSKQEGGNKAPKTCECLTTCQWQASLDCLEKYVCWVKEA